jgi:hypothetical protein
MVNEADDDDSVSPQPKEVGMTIPTPASGTLGNVRTWIVATVAAVALALAVLAPSAAQAAPSCVTVRHDAGIITQTVYVTNHCSSTVSFVVHRVGPDSPCLHASPGDTRSYKWSNGLNYQGTTFGCD